MSECHPFRCQVDHLVHHARGIFGFGWALHPRQRIVQASLVLRFADEREERVRIAVDRPREDVANAFPGNPLAEHSGFLLLAGWPEASPASAELQFSLEGGAVERVPLTLTARHRCRRSVGWGYLLRRSWAHLRQGRVRALVHKVRRHRHRVRLAAGDLAPGSLARAVAGRSCVLVIDHSMGGGANAYRERVVGEANRAGETVVILTFEVSTLSLVAEVRVPGAPPRALAVDGLGAVASALGRARLRSVLCNCLVSFPQPLDVVAFATGLKRSARTRLVVAMHDYFAVCPSSFLLDDQGRFCGVPGIDRCRSCLRKHPDGFVSFTAERSIDHWRAAWGEALRDADEIRCFSDSSRRLVERAYPAAGARVIVVPHEVEPLRRVEVAPAEDATLVLGVIGSISHHKGAGVVADLARTIAAEGAPVRIVILGHVDARCPPHVVEQTGPYRRDELPALVERHGIGMVLLPSVCPETFSFVAHEVLAMGLPLACLDLGAQADLARAHPRGHVARRTDGPGLLAEILAFAAAVGVAPAALRGTPA